MDQIFAATVATVNGYDNQPVLCQDSDKDVIISESDIGENDLRFATGRYHERPAMKRFLAILDANATELISADQERKRVWLTDCLVKYKQQTSPDIKLLTRKKGRSEWYEITSKPSEILRKLVQMSNRRYEDYDRSSSWIT